MEADAQECMMCYTLQYRGEEPATDRGEESATDRYMRIRVTHGGRCGRLHDELRTFNGFASNFGTHVHVPAFNLRQAHSQGTLYQQLEQRDLRDLLQGALYQQLEQRDLRDLLQGALYQQLEQRDLRDLLQAASDTHARICDYKHNAAITL
eukprot:1161541-Pelagomonas_calceolata.AAC.6